MLCHNNGNSLYSTQSYYNIIETIKKYQFSNRLPNNKGGTFQIFGVCLWHLKRICIIISELIKSKYTCSSLCILLGVEVVRIIIHLCSQVIIEARSEDTVVDTCDTVDLEPHNAVVPIVDSTEAGQQQIMARGQPGTVTRRNKIKRVSSPSKILR